MRITLGYFTRRPIYVNFFTVPHLVPLRVRNVSEKRCREKQIFSVQQFLFASRDNVEKYCRVTQATDNNNVCVCSFVMCGCFGNM